MEYPQHYRQFANNSRTYGWVVVGIFGLILIAFLLQLFIGRCFAQDLSVPEPKVTKLTGGSVAVGPSSAVLFALPYHEAKKALQVALKSLPSRDEEVDVNVEILSSQMDGLDETGKNKLLNKEEGYMIEINDDGIKIIGSDQLGALHGVTTFEVMVRNGKGELKRGIVADWPDLETRVLHLVLRKGVKYVEAKKFLSRIRYGHYNTLILMLVNSVKLESMKELVSNNEAWTRKQFEEFANYARDLGFEKIGIEIKLLSHQEKLLRDVYPNLMFNKSTYDPREGGVYKLIFPMLEEIVSLVKPDFIHIGHDELNKEIVMKNGKENVRELGKNEMLPADLFLKDILKIHKYLISINVDTWMWGDMLISKREFPGMFKKHLHGNKDYISIRDKIPKDVVICDWHYFDRQKKFPSFRLFADLGHKVLGATWHKDETIRNFSRYVAEMPGTGKGMIATTWYNVRNRGWEPLEEIAMKSAEYFWNASRY